MSRGREFIIILDMIPAVFGKLKDSGFFFDPVARDIETNFIPSLLEKVKTKVRFYSHRMITFYILMPLSLKLPIQCDEAELAQLVLDELIRHVIKQRLEAYSKLSEAENAATEESS